MMLHSSKCIRVPLDLQMDYPPGHFHGEPGWFSLGLVSDDSDIAGSQEIFYRENTCETSKSETKYKHNSFQEAVLHI